MRGESVDADWPSACLAQRRSLLVLIVERGGSVRRGRQRMTSTVKERPTVEREHQLTVALRIRPLLAHEVQKVSRVAYKVDDKTAVLVDPHGGDITDPLRAKRITDRRYNFDWVFDCTTPQEEVYQQTTKHLVDDVMNGFNGTVFAYGATGSGKTYTMSGTAEDPGIMARALNDLFSAVRAQNNNAICRVSLAYAEIYNENIRDLLNPASGYLELREDARGNHQVVGLSEVSIDSADEVIRLLMKGNRQRTQESTSANRTSSRSHAMLQVQVRQESEGESAVQEIKTGRLYLVDLAGSERASRTQNTGKRLMEGAHINKSLLALGNCINALAEPSARYVNFRDSKLTRLLKEPLSGNCRTVMVAHIGPSAWNYEESRKTLTYASRAKNITNKVRSNVADVTHHVAQYHVIIRELRQEIQKLHDKLGTQEREISSCSPESRAITGGGTKKLGGTEMKRLKSELIACFNHQMELRRKLMTIENALMVLDGQFEKFGFMVSEWENEAARSPADKKEEYPEYIQHAWDDVRQLEDAEKNYLQLRDDVQRQLEECRQKTHTLMESLPEKASSLEQRELLTLLARVHQLEIENMEMQAAHLIRDQELRQRELMILRYDRQRQLCDEIITKQRALLDDISSGKAESSDESNKELMILYRLYQQELQDLLDGRDSVVNSGRQRFTVMSRPLGSSESMMDLTQDNSPSLSIGGNSVDRLFVRRNNGKTVGEESLSEPSTPAERTRTWRLPSLTGDKNITSRVVGPAFCPSRAPTWISLEKKRTALQKNENLFSRQLLPSLDSSKRQTPNFDQTPDLKERHKKRTDSVQHRSNSRKIIPKTKRTPPENGRLKPLEQLVGLSLPR